MLAVVVWWLLGLVLPAHALPVTHSPLIPNWGSALLGGTCMLQFAFSKWLDSHYDRGLGRNYFWMIWYPLVFWLITTAATIVGYPKAYRLGTGQRARWTSPDRGAHLGVDRRKPKKKAKAEETGHG